MNDSTRQFIKDPDGTEWFGVDWTERLAGVANLIAPDTLATSTWSAGSGINIVSTHMSGNMTGVKVSGGGTGTNYPLTNVVTTTVNGETLSTTIYVYIKDE